ncbi:MAG: hypothetical protein AAF628_04165 [Planctomycetota bacterium]
MLRTLSLSSLLGAALAAAPVAQSAPKIIGATGVTPTVLSQDVGTCAPMTCTPGGIGPAFNPFTGATAYDPTRGRGLWITDGLMLAKVDPRNSCAPLCPPIPFPNTTPNNPVTGMAYNEITNTLFVTDLSNVIRWYNVSGSCSLTIVGRCIATVPPGLRLTSCATDDLNGLIYYTATDPTMSGGIVFCAPQTAPCSIICSFVVNSCGGNPMGPLVGAAWDACQGGLWLTDGRQTTLRQLGAGCALGPELQCCINPTFEPYTGIDLLPSTEDPAGPNCTSGTCNICPTMAHTLVGDPTLGNPSFGLLLDDAPSGSSAFVFLNIGACASPGVFAPPLCAPLLVPVVPPPGSAGPFFVPGAGCGDVFLPLGPLPGAPSLCGLTLSTQWVGFCPGGGTFSSNCLSWTITSS